MGSSELELPDDIIHDIITEHLLCDPTLTNKTAIRLSLVSKEFSRAVKRRPSLVFEWDNDPSSKTRCLQELEYMVSTLNQDSHHLETLTIRVVPSLSDSYIYDSIYVDDYSSFDRCIKMSTAKSRGLINLNLRLWDTYVLPKHVFKIESLVQLDLESCRLPAVENVMTWPNLKKVRLSFVSIKNEVFENIIKGCPALEILKILFCKFNTPAFHIKVSNLFCLKQFDIQLTDHQTFEVNATPDLKCLVYHHPSRYHSYLVDLGKYEYSKLRRLTLCNPIAFKHDLFDDMEHQFPRLEELCISETKPSIKTIRISSSSLKKINLELIQGLEEAIFYVPNLLFFKFSGEVDVVPKLLFPGHSGGWTSRIRYTISNANIDTSLFLKLKKFLAANAINDTSIRVYLYEGVTEFHIVNDHPQISADFLGTIQGVTIRRELRTFCLSFASKVLDGIFSICRPRRISVMRWPDCEFPKLIYDNLLGLQRFDDHQLMWNLASTYVHVRETQLPYLVHLNLPQVLDKDKFLELFSVDDDDWKPVFNVGFELEY